MAMSASAFSRLISASTAAASRRIAICACAARSSGGGGDGACGRGALDGAIDQAIEPLDGGLGEHPRDQVLALLARRHDAVETAQRLVEALGIETLVVAADPGAVLAHRRQVLERRQHGAGHVGY